MEPAEVICVDFKYKFISEPPDDLKCLICFEVAKEPRQHGKCGRLFCQDCLNTYGMNKPCPNCKMEKPQYFEDNKSRREIKSLSVRCNNVEQRSKCGWVGTVGTLHDHLTACDYTLVECPRKCRNKSGETKFLMKKDINKHMPFCPNRNYTCKHCGEKGTHALIMQNHDKICEKKMISCSNAECRQKMQRQHLPLHLKFECEFSVSNCKYQSIGCTAELKRKDMAAHEEDSSLHFNMAIDTVAMVKEECTHLKRQCEELKERSTRTDKASATFTFKLAGYSKHMREKTRFYSPNFLSSPQGYLVQALVNVFGEKDGEGTHVSVFALFLEGKYDADLKWPFVGTITITLLNQVADDSHYTMPMEVESSNDMRAGLGYGKFISHETLMSKAYLRDDALYFRVSVDPGDNKPWLKCTV